jgi:ribosomal protein S18 acetylase RimI-like enzyme
LRNGRIRNIKKISDNLAQIKPLTAAEIPVYGEVIRGSFSTVAKDFGWTRENAPGHTSFITNEQLAEKYKEGYYPFGYEYGGEIFGFVSLTDMGGGVFELNDLAVLPECRHLGYGKKLLDFCKAKVLESGGNKITLGIVEENAAVKKWYTANGFKHTGTQIFPHLPFKVGFMEWIANQ